MQRGYHEEFRIWYIQNTVFAQEGYLEDLRFGTYKWGIKLLAIFFAKCRKYHRRDTSMSKLNVASGNFQQSKRNHNI